MGVDSNLVGTGFGGCWHLMQYVGQKGRQILRRSLPVLHEFAIAQNAGALFGPQLVKYDDLEHRSNLRASIVEQLREADESIVDFSTRVLGGMIQLFLHYSGLRAPIPATRLSDGTIRYLCLRGRRLKQTDRLDEIGFPRAVRTYEHVQ